MDIHRTGPQQCTKRSCKNTVPPPEPNERDYSTCASCRSRDAASKKKRKRAGAQPEGTRLHIASMVGGQDGGQSVIANSGSGPGKDIEPAGDVTGQVSKRFVVLLSYSPDMSRSNLLICMQTAVDYLMRYGQHSKENMSTSSELISYQKTRWSAIARGSE